MSDLKSLRQKAEAAKITWGQEGWITNDRFRAAASPDIILELLDLLEEAEQIMRPVWTSDGCSAIGFVEAREFVARLQEKLSQ